MAVVGRPMRYRTVIEALDELTVYTPRTIADFAQAHGMLDAEPGDAVAVRLARQRIRIAMGRFSNNHRFPDLGDGMVTVPGQPPTPGWYGWRWQAAARERFRGKGRD